MTFLYHVNGNKHTITLYHSLLANSTYLILHQWNRLWHQVHFIKPKCSNSLWCNVLLWQVNSMRHNIRKFQKLRTAVRAWNSRPVGTVKNFGKKSKFSSRVHEMAAGELSIGSWQIGLLWRVHLIAFYTPVPRLVSVPRPSIACKIVCTIPILQLIYSYNVLVRTTVNCL